MRRIKSHTRDKLTYFEKYLNAYLSATKRLPTKIYIDAFSGTGKCMLCNHGSCKSRGGKKCLKCPDSQKREVDGSALIALKAKKEFDGYMLIESVARNCKSLEKFIKSEISPDRVLKTEIINRDSNKFLQESFTPDNAAYLIFFDPEGSELSWDTIKVLKNIKKADILILYPYDMSLVRLTTNFKHKLDNFYGDSNWLEEFNKGVNPTDRKTRLRELYIANLKKLGFEYVVSRQIKTRLREGRPLYHLILATHSQVGDKIIKDIFDKELDGQQKLDF